MRLPTLLKFSLIGAGVLAAGFVGLLVLGLTLSAAGYGGRRAQAAGRSSNAAPSASPVSPNGTAVAANLVHQPAPNATGTHASAQPSSEQPPSTTSGLTARLDALEQGGKFVDIGLLLFQQAATLSPADRAAAIKWLTARRLSGRMPVLFLIARLHDVAGDSEQAGKWFLAASCIGRIDAQRCDDRSAGQAVPAMESHFPAVRTALRADKAKAEKWARAALAMEEELKDREPPYWIAAHGLAAFTSKAPSFIGEEAWADHRQKCRESLTSSLAGAPADSD